MKAANKDEDAHMERVRQLGCIIGRLFGRKDCCPGTQAHHLTEGGRRISHYHTIPLCFNHHQAQTPLKHGHAVHKGTKTFEFNYKTQEELLSITKDLLGKEITD